jgi:hypothetical protein
MEVPMKQRPLTVYLLLFFLLFLAFGGLYGGIAMLTDPDGSSLAMDSLLPLLPVASFILPGLFLLLVMGLTPLMLSYGLLMQPARTVTINGRYWAWTGTVALALLLAVWLAMQGVLIGFQWPIQYVTAVNGLLILLLAFTPGVRNHYAR